MKSNAGSSGDWKSDGSYVPEVGGSNPSPRTRPWIEWGRKLGLSECPYLIRWLIDLRIFSIRLHHWIGSDDKRYFHDHPWWFVTVVLKGGYIDVSPKGNDHLTLGSIRIRPMHHRHSVYVDPVGAWTLLLTGPGHRKFGFWVNGKFKKANKYFLEHGHHPCN